MSEGVKLRKERGRAALWEMMALQVYCARKSTIFLNKDFFGSGF